MAETAKGGVGTIINELTSKNCLYESWVLVPDVHSKYIQSPNKFEFIRTGRNIKSFLSLATECIKVIKYVRPDIIHLHSTFAGAIVRMLLLLPLFKNKYRVVYTPHAFSFMMKNNNVIINSIAVYLERFLSIFTDVITCNSRYEYDIGKKSGIKENKLSVIYNGVPEQIVENSPKVNQSKINILFVGRFDYQKGYDILLDLINILGENYNFCIIGDSVNDTTPIIERDNICYLGWLDNNKISEFYKKSTFLFMPSRWESFGLVAVEAQSFGLPVLANNIGSLPEVIHDGTTGFLMDFSNIENIANFIKSMDENAWIEMRDSCIKFSKEKFTTQKMIDEYMKTYEALYARI
ncbi:TPA: glycosyltransferase family 4 protein [Klebsiella pneumoniae]|nr:glycosyltransferase family 4 protein [Klebsiella pneumoniae]